MPAGWTESAVPATTEPVTTSVSSALEEKKPPSPREKLQPPELAPIRNSVIMVPKGRIANRPTRPHALYRLGCSVLWDAGGRNSVLRT